MIKIMLSAGEVSGDLHGSALADELKKINNRVYLFGMGGEKMRSAGVDIKIDITSRGTVGIAEIIRHIPYLLSAFLKMRSILKKEKPDLLVLIDYQGFNMLLASAAKKIGIKTAYYIPPQEWLWGTKKGVINVANTIGRIISIFEDEARIYKNAGGNVTYVGNPNLDTAKPTMNKDSFCKLLGLNPKFPIFGLFPGSRIQEIEFLLKIVLDASRIIKAKVPNAQFVLSLSSEHFRSDIKKLVAKSGLDIPIIHGHNHNILNSSNISIAASGTTTMEAVILDAPVVTFYKVSQLSYFIGKYILRIGLPFYAMPNILANKEVIPELIQSNLTPENISCSVLRLLTDKNEMAKMKEGFRAIRARMGAPGAVKRAAETIFFELKGKI